MPARPLTQGLPISYDTGEKEIDLKDKKGMFNFNSRREIQTKEMPVTILVPNPRNMYCQQISFASIAKTIMTLTFFNRRKHRDENLANVLKTINFLQEFDVKVQQEQCLL
jgi:hypothetical protein